MTKTTLVLLAVLVAGVFGLASTNNDRESWEYGELTLGTYMTGLVGVHEITWRSTSSSAREYRTTRDANFGTTKKGDRVADAFWKKLTGSEWESADNLPPLDMDIIRYLCSRGWEPFQVDHSQRTYSERKRARVGEENWDYTDLDDAGTQYRFRRRSR